MTCNFCDHDDCICWQDEISEINNNLKKILDLMTKEKIELTPNDQQDDD